MLKNLWKSRTQATRARQTLGRCRLRVERLEDRCVPAAVGEFPLPTANSSPFGITPGPDGSLWFTENQANQIGMINPSSHAVAEFAIPTASSGPLSITTGPDGNLWFTEFSANQIGMLNPTTHAVNEFAIPTANSGPSGIALGPDGNLWFTEFTAGQVAEINPTTHAITEFPLPTAGSAPLGITAGPDGNLWIAESQGNNIATINPIVHNITEYPIPLAASQPYDITTGPNGNIWFSKNGVSAIGEINITTHLFSNFPTPTQGSGPFGITSGADGNIWFIEAGANQVGEVNVATGAVYELPLPTAGASPTAIARAPGGTLWITESNSSQIGEVVAPAQISSNPVSQSVMPGQTATFTTAAIGMPTPTVQWEVSANGGTSFTPLTNGGVYSGVNTDTLSVTGVTSAMSGYQYVAVFVNGVSPTPSAITPAVTLTVKSVLSVGPTLPQAAVGAAYNQTLSVLGNTTPIDLLTVNNLNPGATGLTLSDFTPNTSNGTIAITGTPTGAGTATFTVTVADTAGDSLTQNLSIIIGATLSVSPSSLLATTAGMPYTQTVTVAGGASPYMTLTVTGWNAGGTGLTAANVVPHPVTGVVNISGTPTAAGTATFTVNVTDSAGATISKTFSIAVHASLAITASLPAGTAGTAYNQTLHVTGGGQPYAQLTITQFNAGTTGLTMNAITPNLTAGTVAIAGTPTAAGTFTFTVNAVDAVGAALHQTYSVTVHPAAVTLAVGNPSTTQWTANRSGFTTTLSISGGTAPYTLVNSTLPPGVTANLTGSTIKLTGTPTATGTFADVITIHDASGNSLHKTFSLVISPALTLGNPSTTQWTVNHAGFTSTLSISGGTAPYTLVSAILLPAGLTASLTGTTIKVTGTPTATGTFAGIATIHDAGGNSLHKTISLVINAVPSIGGLAGTQWTLNHAGYTGHLTVTGGTGGLTITSSTGVPPGLHLVVSGRTLSFTGTPTRAGVFAGSVTLHDTLGVVATRTFSIKINQPPTLGALTVSQWTMGKSGFTGAIPITAGTGPFTITSATGLPTGLTAVISGTTIRLIGTPTHVGTFATGSITIHDTAGTTVATKFSVTVHAALQITTTSLPSAKPGVAYNAGIHTSGGTGTVTFAVTAGSLPPGMKLSTYGVITGLSKSIGTFKFTITATDAVGATFSEKLTLSV